MRLWRFDDSFVRQVLKCQYWKTTLLPEVELVLDLMATS